MAVTGRAQCQINSPQSALSLVLIASFHQVATLKDLSLLRVRIFSVFAIAGVRVLTERRCHQASGRPCANTRAAQERGIQASPNKSAWETRHPSGHWAVPVLPGPVPGQACCQFGSRVHRESQSR